MDRDESKYTSLSLLIEPGQEKRIIRALKSGKGCVIYVRKSEKNTFDSSNKLDGNHATRGVLHLTKRHIKKYHKADAGAKVGLKLDRHELQYNRKHQTGGFIPFLLPLLGAVAAGATTSLVDNALSKKGSGLLDSDSSSSRQLVAAQNNIGKLSAPALLWYKKHKRAVDVESSDQYHTKKKKRPFILHITPDKHDGDGLRLAPWPIRTLNKHFDRSGYGLYLSPYPLNYKGLGLTKLEHRSISKHCYRNFNKKQIKCVKQLVCE